MHAPTICSTAHLVVELVGCELECGKHVGSTGHGTQHGTSGAAGQLDVNPLRRLSGTSFLSHINVDPIRVAVQLCQALKPGLRTAAELSANGRVVGPDDDIHPGNLLT
jgi:hypothetical protein